MKLPNWFKIIWWIGITGFTAYLFYLRFPTISQNKSTPIDSFIFIILVALLLVPIFQEISLFGLKFKQAIDELKQNISMQLTAFKSDIQTTITNTSNVNLTFPYSPPPDDQLPGLEQRIRLAISEVLQEEGLVTQVPLTEDRLEVDDDVEYLFRIRHTIEKKLRAIASSFAHLPDRRPIPIHKLSNILVNQELLHPKIAHAIREIYSVCSPAIHGEPVTKAQVNFVKDVAPQVIDALNQIERRTKRST